MRSLSREPLPKRKIPSSRPKTSQQLKRMVWKTGRARHPEITQKQDRQGKAGVVGDRRQEQGTLLSYEGEACGERPSNRATKKTQKRNYEKTIWGDEKALAIQKRAMEVKNGKNARTFKPGKRWRCPMKGKREERANTMNKKRQAPVRERVGNQRGPVEILEGKKAIPQGGKITIKARLTRPRTHRRRLEEDRTPSVVTKRMRRRPEKKSNGVLPRNKGRGGKKIGGEKRTVHTEHED